MFLEIDALLILKEVYVLFAVSLGSQERQPPDWPEADPGAAGPRRRGQAAPARMDAAARPRQGQGRGRAAQPAARGLPQGGLRLHALLHHQLPRQARRKLSEAMRPDFEGHKVLNLGLNFLPILWTYLRGLWNNVPFEINVSVIS